jgi:tetratricopeptide (TPR) repeat protein
MFDSSAAETEPIRPIVPPKRARTFPRTLLFVLLGLLFVCGLIGMVGVAGFAGAQAGQQQALIRQTSTVAAYVIDRFDKGNQQLREGNYELAQANFEEILRYQPDNYGVRDLAATAIAAQTPTAVPPTLTPTPVITDKGRLLTLAQTAAEQEDWDTVIALTNELIDLDASYQRETVSDLRYDALLARGTARIRSDAIEQGIYDLDLAAQIRALPDRIAGEKRLAAAYQNALYYVGADWERAIDLLEEVYNASPQYRDVATRLLGAYVDAGDAYSAAGNPCAAARQYTRAVQFSKTPRLEQKQRDADLACLTAPSAISGTVSTSTTIFNTASISGRLLYSRFDPNTNQYRYFIYDSASSTAFDTGGGQQPDIRPSSSPDGARITYQLFQDDGWKVIVANSGGTNVQILTNGTSPAWGPGYIAYQSCTDQCGIHLINPDNPSDVRRLTSSANDINMQWSPAGDRIIYMSNNSGSWEIYTVTPSGGFQQLTGFGATSAAPTFSPDGTRIAFISNRDGNWGLWIMNVDGSNTTKLIDLGAQFPSWQLEKLSWLP